MTFKQRLPYFLGGLTIGIIVVTFFLGKKETTFDYGPNARILKNIRIKHRAFSSEALLILSSNRIDTTAISQILKNGDVDIRNKVKLDSCFYEYEITGEKNLKDITLTVINCDSTAIIKNITFQ